MRKLYTLAAGMFLFLVTMKTIAQQSVFNLTTTTDQYYNQITPVAFSDEEKNTGQLETDPPVNNINQYATCQANFEESLTPNSSLYKKFTAIPWHSEQKRPVYICWQFGDGKDTCIQYSNTFSYPYTVVHQYQHPGTYEVCVKIVYQDGCEAKKCKSIIIGETCKADFEKIPLTTTISPLFVTYKALPWNSNNKKPKKICWQFGNGKDTCIEYPENYTGTYLVRHNYREAGLYQVCVKILYYGGCEAYNCKAIQIGRRDECKIDFERIPVLNTDNPLVAGFKAIPYNNNNKVPKLICWDFGDGSDTCVEYAQNFSGPYTIRHKYNAPGTYTVCVKAIYYGGCEAKICKSVTVKRPDECKADFERVQVAPTINPLLAYFKAIPAHNNNKKPKQICWKFGDGRDTCIQYPENFTGTYVIKHQYREAGSYEVCVKILYYGGCEAYNCKKIIVGRPDECKADFERVQVASTLNPLLAYFKAIPAHNNNKKPKQICWRFGDGKDTCITYPENFTGTYVIKHEYREPGNYEVCVKILYYGGCEAYNCKKIQIGHPVECKADFERLPVTTNNPLHVAFKALPSHSSDKKPKLICWYFGDGRDTCIEYDENYTGIYGVRHAYRQPGSYEVCVKILYFGGCEAKKCELIKVEGPGECRVNLFELTPSITSLVRGFYASPWSSVNKKPVRICWYFGDGSDTCIEINSTTILHQLFIRHTYPAPGLYRACVKILFEGGCIASDCEEVIIKPATNICGGYLTDSLVSPRTFKFKGFAINNPNDPVIGYRWSFGDGSSASGREATHTYNAPGSYEVCLTIKTQHGCETKICKKIVVPGNTQPVIHISPNPVANQLHLLFYSTHTEQVNIRIVNASGVIVKNYSRNATTGANNWDFDVTTLTPGSYMLYVQSANQLSSQLFIKQ